MAVLVCGLAARRFRVAPPVLLLACGALLGFATALRRVHLPPEVVLLLFLPALLYWESITTSLREIRSNLRTIILLSTGLVIATAAAVAAVAHALGLGWGPAWVLGAAVAPTDATAVGVLAVVVCGLIISQAGPRLGRADTRQQTVAFWSLATFLLNGALFVLVGLELKLAAGLGTDPEVSGRLNREYAKHLRLLRANDAGADDEPALRYDQQYTALRLAVLAHKRATVLRLRDERRIDDIVLRQIQTRLDIEEVRLSRRETVE